jgi:hypothetical protein
LECEYTRSLQHVTSLIMRWTMTNWNTSFCKEKSEDTKVVIREKLWRSDNTNKRQRQKITTKNPHAIVSNELHPFIHVSTVLVTSVWKSTSSYVDLKIIKLFGAIWGFLDESIVFLALKIALFVFFGPF